MILYISETYVILTTIISVQVHGQGCPVGWFGENCRLMCMCRQSSTCNMAGECPNNESCKAGVYGPGCQYVDLSYWRADVSVAYYLWDSDDSTCNPNSDATYIEISQKPKFPVTMFRIYAKDGVNLLNFKTTINDGLPCTNERKFVFSNNVVDVTCDNFIIAYSLRIEGPIAPSVCSIYISGGRNVAIKQHATQSSNFDPSDFDKYKAANAVDGVDGYVSSGQCSQTAVETKPPVLNLTFDRPKLLLFVRVCNVDKQYPGLLGFVLETFDEAGRSISYFREGGSVASRYDVHVPSTIPVKSIKITKGSNKAAAPQMLTVCEIEAYGDNSCPDGTFGLFCEGRCNCSKTEICFPLTGVCAPACQPGFCGYNCTSSCAENCLDGICEWLSGHCLRCSPGYKGDLCDTECTPGTFGDNCSGVCSLFCEDQTCDTIEGHCFSCVGTHKGNQCQDCADGYYGENCTQVCPYFCRDNLCNNVSGDCFSCVGNRKQQQCEECGFGFYGENCTESCSKYCLDRNCSQDTGYCLSCIGERHGLYCEECLHNHYGPVCQYVCTGNCLNLTCDQVTGLCTYCAAGYDGEYCLGEAPSYYLYLAPLLPLYLLVCCFLLGCSEAIQDSEGYYQTPSQTY